MTSVAIGEEKWERRNRVELHNHRLCFDDGWYGTGVYTEAF